jgi:DNA-binding NarL/FixJ family response regulator
MKVMLVEDQQLLRDTLTEALCARGVEVVIATSEPDALATVDREAPDLAVLDIRLPPTMRDEGLRIAEALRTGYPDVALVVLSSYGEITYARRLLSMPGGTRSVGYLLKDRVAGIDGLVADLHRVAAGQLVIDSQLVEQLMRRPATSSHLERLTPRQRQILALCAEGYSDLGIAQKLKIEVGNVEKYLTEIRQKLALPSKEDPHRASYNVRVLAVLAFLEGAGTDGGDSGRAGS